MTVVTGQLYSEVL